jgi:hypothetical protein
MLYAGGIVLPPGSAVGGLEERSVCSLVSLLKTEADAPVGQVGSPLRIPQEPMNALLRLSVLANEEMRRAPEFRVVKVPAGSARVIVIRAAARLNLLAVPWALLQQTRYGNAVVA